VSASAAPAAEPVLRRPAVRLGLFAASGLAAGVLGFAAFPIPVAEKIVRYGGYFIMLLTFALAVLAVVRWWRRRPPSGPPLSPAERWVAAGFIAGFSFLAINAEPFRSKILNDEFVLQATAFNMHHYREVATMVRAYDVLGTFVTTDNYLDKRPYFYPFLIALLHDLTGYRPLNAFLVNALLMPVTLWLAYLLGHGLHRHRGGLLAVALLGSLPLLGQNATGTGMELLNVAMILAGTLLARDYLRDPDEPALAAFLLVIVLLAQSRYESAAYVAPAGLIVLLGWWRAGRIRLPWEAWLVPLLLVPCALHQRVLANSPLLWELKDNATSRFSLSFLPDNLASAGNFLFSLSLEMANSLLLTVVGLAAVVWVLVDLVRRRPSLRTADPAGVALAGFGLAALGTTLLVFCYYWAGFSDRMAARFALPLHLILAFAAVLFARHLDRRGPATAALLLLAGLFTLGVTASKYDYHHYSHLGIDEIEWQRRVIDARAGDGERLIITNNSTLPWLLDRRPSILLARARIVGDRLAHQLAEPTFREILVLQSMRPSTADGDHQLVPEETLPDWYKLEPVAERRFGTKIALISRLVAVNLPKDYRPQLVPDAPAYLKAGTQ